MENKYMPRGEMCSFPKRKCVISHPPPRSYMYWYSYPKQNKFALAQACRTNAFIDTNPMAVFRLLRWMAALVILFVFTTQPCLIVPVFVVTTNLLSQIAGRWRANETLHHVQLDLFLPSKSDLTSIISLGLITLTLGLQSFAYCSKVLSVLLCYLTSRVPLASATIALLVQLALVSVWWMGHVYVSPV